ncbi:uncharacterized protein EV420DRAFT_1485283 [Desarmillaria tabescens]|uniref:Uncharacterized protein n=1 Tax=Armillaria tabescens TaxID=1929756 RepID=A0AA39JIU9_ARMTA|nr:uncharacterized protein EV420DRAFT_1485283 [Desarmillaria tabescens]KAK0442740.1 hypothetical protein EV420DRAFT_1485283 [Desarmillaria tabescens]
MTWTITVTMGETGSAVKQCGAMLESRDGLWGTVEGMWRQERAGRIRQDGRRKIRMLTANDDVNKHALSDFDGQIPCHHHVPAHHPDACPFHPVPPPTGPSISQWPHHSLLRCIGILEGLNTVKDLVLDLEGKSQAPKPAPKHNLVMQICVGITYGFESGI